MDIHIRLFTPGQPSVVDPLHAVSLTSCDLIPVASPEYLRRNGPVLNELDLMSHSLLHSSTDERWRNWFRARGYGAPVRLPGMCLGTGELSVRAAGEGLGVALTSHFLSAGELASGRVLEVKLAEHPCKKTQGCYLFVARSDRWSSPAIAGLRQWMLQQAAFTPRLVANEMTGEEPIRRAG